jgi:hypothetical protein
MAHPLVTISYADKEERKQIAQWLQDPLYYQDAFLLPTCPDPAWVNAGFLLIQNPNGQELVSVNFWAIKEQTKRKSKTQTAETNKEDQLLGFSIDYPSDIHLRNIREIDLALPNAHGSRGRMPFEAMAWTVHAVFQKENPLQIRTRVRSAGGRGFPRMFALVGALQTPISGLHLEDKRYRDRIEYYATPEMFYNSYWAKLHGLQIKP